MNLPFNSRPTAGIDLGSRNIKGIELEKKEDIVYLKNFFFHDLSTSSPDYPNFPQVKETLCASVEVNQFQNKKVVTSLGSSEADSIELSIPKIPDKEIPSAVKFELERRLDNVPIDQITYDYLILDEPTREGQIPIKVFYAADSIVTQHLDMLEDCHLHPKLLDIQVLALIKMLDFNSYLSEMENNLLIDIGENQTTIALVKGRDLSSSNTTPFSFGMITQNLMENLELDYQNADKIKQIYSLFDEHDQVSQKDEIIEASFVHFFDNIQETMDYFIEKSAQPISKVFLTGGGSLKDDIRHVIEHHYNIKAVLPNPFKNIEIADQDNSDKPMPLEKLRALAPFMCTSLGLALRGVLSD